MDRTFILTFTNHIRYEIKRCTHIFDVSNPDLRDCIITKRVFCLLDNGVEHHTGALDRYFQVNNIEAHYYYLTPSEEKKNLESIREFASFCFDQKISRLDSIIGFGGGIICDLAGLSANLIRRGTPCIKIPTTLLGIIDASIGVKTGINYHQCKNSLGTYSPPKAVLIDLIFLKSLAEKEIKNGLVEMIKIISLKDKMVWLLLKESLEQILLKDLNEQVIDLIDNSISFMIEELSSNLFENDLNRIVDFGHEFGHLIETISNYKLSHGQAVGIGMMMSNIIALNKGLMICEDFEDFKAVFLNVKFPCWHESLSAEKLYAKIDSITRHKGDVFSIVALKEIGHPIFIHDIAFADLKTVEDILIDMQAKSVTYHDTSITETLLNRI